MQNTQLTSKTITGGNAQFSRWLEGSIQCSVFSRTGHMST